MRQRWIVIGLCCSILCFSGCADNKQPDNSSEGSKGQEADKQDSEVKATELEPGIGEGTSSMELQDLSESEEFKLGETISMSVDGKEYELRIDSVSYTEKRDPYASDAENVVLVDYSYHNLSEEPLLLGDIRFQLTDSEREKVYEPYYLSEQVIAEPVEKGESFSAQVAFAQVDEDKELLLVYTDISSEDTAPVIVRIDEIRSK